MNVAQAYFDQNPEAKDSVMKAYYAFHVRHFRDDGRSHNFPGTLRGSKCQWCGRSREDVRYDALPPECASRPAIPDIEESIMSEEERAFDLLDRAATGVPKLVERHGMSGKTLAMLHHTHGFDPETVSGIVDVPPELLAEYHVEMDKERERSAAAHISEEIRAKTY